VDGQPFTACRCEAHSSSTRRPSSSRNNHPSGDAEPSEADRVDHCEAEQRSRSSTCGCSTTSS
jgi:hypothetical protein